MGNTAKNTLDHLSPTYIPTIINIQIIAILLGFFAFHTANERAVIQASSAPPSTKAD